MDLTFTIISLVCGIFLSVDGDPSPPILDTESVGKCDRFVMTCSPSSFDGVPTSSGLILWISAHRHLKHEDDTMLAMFPPLTDQTPIGRNWYVRTTGQSGDIEGSKLKLKLIVNDGRCSDAGEYYCKMKISDVEEPIISSKITLPNRPPLHIDDSCGCGEFDNTNIGPKIVDKNVVGTGDHFTVGCNYSSFTDKGLVVNSKITLLELIRSTDDGDNVTIAQYDPFVESGKDAVMKNIPDDRLEVIAEGGNSSTNKDSIHLTLKVQDATCDDAGIYTCKAKVDDSPTEHTSTPFRLHPKYSATLLMDKIKVTPYHNDTAESLFESSDEIETAFNYLGENVTMECTYHGEHYLKTKWATSKGIFIETGKHFRPTPTKDAHGCPTHFHRSIYSFVMSVSDDKATYYCAAMKGVHEVGKTKVKFFSLDKIPYVPLINKDTIGTPDTFNMACNAATFKEVEMPLIDNFKFIAMTREINDDEDMFATYGPFNYELDEEPFGTSLPEHRLWEFSYYGGGERPNRDVLNLTVKVSDANCDDAGIYYCMVGLTGHSGLFRSEPFRLNPKIREMTLIDNLKITPDVNVTVDTSYNEIGETVTLECSYSGLDTLKARWSNSKNSEQLYGATESVPRMEKGGDGCPIYMHKSVYTFNTSASDHQVTYTCSVYKGDHQVATASMNFYIDLSGLPVSSLPTTTNVVSVVTAEKTLMSTQRPSNVPDFKYSFTVTCDSSMFESGLVNENKPIMSLGIFRAGNTEEEKPIALYMPLEVEGEQIKSYAPEGRQWFFNTSVEVSEQPFYKIEMTVNDAMCDDYGQYKCGLAVSGEPNMAFSSVVLPKGYFPPECMTDTVDHFTITSTTKPPIVKVTLEKEALTTEKSYGTSYIIMYGLLSLLIVPVVFITLKICGSTAAGTAAQAVKK